MKNILLPVVLAFGLVSCGGGSSDTNTLLPVPTDPVPVDPVPVDPVPVDPVPVDPVPVDPAPVDPVPVDPVPVDPVPVDPAPVDPVPVDPVPVDPVPVDPAPTDPLAEIQITFDFTNIIDAWEVGFSDYPVGAETLYELASSITQLPFPLENQTGINVSGTNRSDDLFMFIKKQFSGFEANTQYQLQFEITFATNAPAGCIGIGGAPGEAVTVKAGATATEPLPLDNGNGSYLMNIDKGNQRIGGNDAMSVGDFANAKDCADDDFSYELKTLLNIENSFSAFTGTDGTLWILFATDSGFEGTTSIFFVSGKLVATRI